MNLVELLEKDKEKLLSDLRSASTMADARSVLEQETDRLRFRFLEETENAARGETASYLFEILRLSLSFLDCVGEKTVWERKSSGGSTSEKKGRMSAHMISLILLLAGVMCFLIPGILKISAFNIVTLFAGAPGQLIIFVLGLICIFASGSFWFRKPGRRADADHPEQIVEESVDPEKAYRFFHACLLSVQQSTERSKSTQDVREAAEKQEFVSRSMTRDQLELYAGLLEAYYSRDGEYALQKISDLLYYLHRSQIEVVDYTRENKEFFDVMPSSQAGTIRPALVFRGGLLQKGLAAGGE